MKLIGIQHLHYLSKKTNKPVYFYKLAFEPANSTGIIGVMATVYSAREQAVNSICELGFDGHLSDMLGHDFTFYLDQFKNISALYIGLDNVD